MERNLTDTPAPIKTFLAATVVLTLLSWLFAFICSFRHLPPIYSWPYNFAQPGSDFTDYQERFRHLHSFFFFEMPGPPYLYPAPFAVAYHLLFSAWGGRPHPIFVLDAVIAASAAAAALLFFLVIRRHGLPSARSATLCLITLILSYPLYYEFQRGNLEVLLWVNLMLATWAFLSGRLQLAAFLIGIAIACKWYPVILLGLFLFPRKWKAIPTALITALAVTILADHWLGPSTRAAVAETSKGMQTFLDVYANHFSAVGYDHSFFAFFKFLLRHHHPNLPRDLNRYLKLAAVSATAIYFLRIRLLPVLNQICVLLILSITLPPVSFDYTLLHLYICWAIFTLYVLDSYRNGSTVPHAGWTMAWFAFAMAPHGYVILAGERYCGQLHLIGLAALLYIFLKYPFAESPRPTQSAALGAPTLSDIFPPA